MNVESRICGIGILCMTLHVLILSISIRLEDEMLQSVKTSACSIMNDCYASNWDCHQEVQFQVSFNFKLVSSELTGEQLFKRTYSKYI